MVHEVARNVEDPSQGLEVGRVIPVLVYCHAIHHPDHVLKLNNVHILSFREAHIVEEQGSDLVLELISLNEIRHGCHLEDIFLGNA